MYQAIGENVIVKVVEKEQEHKGIVLPEAAQRQEFKGEVVSVGLNVEFVELGDVILFDKNASKMINKDEGLIVVPEKHVLAVEK